MKRRRTRHERVPHRERRCEISCDLRLVRGGKFVILEGDWKPSRLVIFRFPDRARAQALFGDPDYRPLKVLRRDPLTQDRGRGRRILRRRGVATLRGGTQRDPAFHLGRIALIPTGATDLL
jgi:Domain of unknown function (DUF1330)